MKNNLLATLKESEIRSYFTRKTYNKGTVIASADEECKYLNVVNSGEISLQTIFPSGHIVTIATLHKGDIFGEALIFASKNKYPITVFCSKDAEILSIDKRNILFLFNMNNRFLEMFLTMISNKLLHLNSKIRILSQNSIRKKLCIYLIDEFNKTNSLTIKIPSSKEILANVLNVPRPSLSRELMSMKDDKLTTYDKKTITILDIEKLEEELF